MDVIPGYWATPWKEHVQKYFHHGAKTVILEALKGFTEKDVSLCYRGPGEGAFERGKARLKTDLSTFPPYAINARGGTVVGGYYTRTKFKDFATRIPPIELLVDYSHQIFTHKLETGDPEAVTSHTAEIMGLDSWLSMAGRLPEIAQGPRDLIHKTPALVDDFIENFESEFASVELQADEGGHQHIESIATEMVETFEDKRLTRAEQLFLLVALLRTIKFAACVAAGPDTRLIRDILRFDLQVYFV
ncbi:MAG: hypothetical protein Q9164_007485 [Protoblastenia rupestris]